MYNIYCDESCHLQPTKYNKSEQQSMVIGGIKVKKELVPTVNLDIRKIKAKYGLNRSEVKWTKVSPSKLNFYKELIEYYFNNTELNFRCIVSQDKNTLRYDKYSHNDIYYIMYFYLLKNMISVDEKNNIYIDKKDTLGGEKVRKLKECLCNEKFDFNQELIDKIQIIDSKDSEIMQLADIIIGAISFANRRLDNDLDKNRSSAKIEIVNLIRSLSKKTLLKSTLLNESKLNVFIFGESIY